MELSKRDFLKKKYASFQSYLVSVSNISSEEFNDNEEIKDFSSMTEEQLLIFATTKLKYYQNDLSYPVERICDIFRIDKQDKSKTLIIYNYLECFLNVCK